MELQIFTPKEVKITFRKIKKEYKLMPFTLAVQGWLTSNYNEAEITKMMTGGDILSLVKLFLKLLDNDSKKHLAENVNMKVIDDETGEEKQLTSLVDKIMYIAESDELEMMLKAILESRGVSLPDENRIKDLEGKPQGE